MGALYFGDKENFQRRGRYAPSLDVSLASSLTDSPPYRNVPWREVAVWIPLGTESLATLLKAKQLALDVARHDIYPADFKRGYN